MRNLISIFLLLCSFKQVCAQSIEGITNERDTSFNTYSAFTSAKKKFPQIEIIPETRYSSAKEKKDIRYCKVGNIDLLLDVFYPKTKKKNPAIIIIFGGGWRSGNRTQHYPLAQKLASLGFICFTPEYRLSTEALYPAAVYDLKAALRWVKINGTKYNVDTSKIAVLGFSAGGELAAFLGTTANNKMFEGTCNPFKNTKVQAVVDIDGTLSFVHPETGEGDDSKKKSAATLWFGFSKKENVDLWKQASPLTYASANTPPTLFINSSVERMHAGREDYIKILKANNIYSEVKTFENSPHTFCLFNPWFEPTVKYIDDFLKKIFK